MRPILSLSLAVFISVQSLLPGLSVLELGKLPALFQHYSSHRSLNSEMSLLDFLELHYSNPSHHDQDHNEHHKLPFNDHHSTVSAVCFYFVSERSFTLSVRYFPIGQTNQTVYHSIVEEELAIHVWQPPRKG
jgi:hypothetical protein